MTPLGIGLGHVLGGGGFPTTLPAGLLASDFDGTNDWSNVAGNMGVNDGQEGILSCWLRLDGGDGANQYIFSSDTGRFTIYRAANNKLYATFTTSGGATLFNKAISVDTLLAGQGWKHILFSWKTNASTLCKCFINGAEEHSSASTGGGDIDYTGSNFYVGAHGGSFKLNGALSEFFFHNSYVDLSVAATREKFRMASGIPAYLGEDGSLPLGVRPRVYLPAGNPADNKGTGGNFSITGALDSTAGPGA